MKTLAERLEAIDVKYAGDVYQAQRARNVQSGTWVSSVIAERRYYETLGAAREQRRVARVQAIEDWRLEQLARRSAGVQDMSNVSPLSKDVSPYLLRPLRTEAQALRDVLVKHSIL